MSRLLTCGWESGSAEEFGIIANAPTISQDISRTAGGYCLKCDSGAGNTTPNWKPYATLVLNSGVAYYARAYLMFPSAPSAACDFWDMRVGTTSGGMLRFNTASSLQVTVRRYIAGSPTNGATFTLTAGRVHMVEMAVYIDASNANAGILGVHLDGVSVENLTGLNFGTTAIGASKPIIGWLTAPGANKVMYIDDFAINDSGGSAENVYPGDGLVKLLRPVLDGPRGAQWTGGAGGTTDVYKGVVSRPPQGVAIGSATDAKQIKNVGTSNHDFDVLMQSYDEAGIARTSTIKVCQAVMNVGCDSATATNGALMAAGNPGGGEEVSFNFSTGAIAGTFPTNWQWVAGKGLPGDIHDYWRATRPRVRIGKRAAVTRAGMADQMGLYVEYTTDTKVVQPEKHEPLSILEIAFLSSPPSNTSQSFGDIVWENVSDRLVEVPTITSGKSEELGVTDAAKMTVVLDNHDRYLEPEFPGSPYYPNVIPLRPIRLRAVWPRNLVPYSSFSGGSLTQGWTNVSTGGAPVVAVTAQYALFDTAAAVKGTTGGTADTVEILSSADYVGGGPVSPFFNFIPVQRDRPYVLSAYFLRPTGAPAPHFHLRLRAYNKLFALLGTPYPDTAVSGVVYQGGQFDPAAGVVDRYGGLFSPNSLPVGTAYVRVDVVLVGGVANATGVATAIQLEDGTVASPYRGEGVYNPQFFGFIDSWPPARKKRGSEVQVNCSDPMALWADHPIQLYFAADEASDRITALLDQANWYYDKRGVSAGEGMIVQQVTLNQESPLNAMQDAALADGGYFNVALDGRPQFTSLTNQTILYNQALAWETFGPPPTYAVAPIWSFSNDPTLGYMVVGEMGTDYGSEKIRNRIEITPANAVTPHVATDAPSQGFYGVRTLTQTLMVNTGADADTRAAALLAMYKYPRLRFTSLKLDPHRDPNIWAPALQDRLGQFLRVVDRPEYDLNMPFYRNNIVGDRPGSYLRLDETSGTTAFDSSGLGQNGTYQGTAGITYLQAGAIADGNKSVRLDGSQARIQLPSYGALVSVVLEGWFYLEGAGSVGSSTYATLFGKSSTRRILVDLSAGFPGSVRVEMGAGAGAMQTEAGLFTLNTWHHVVYVWNGSVETLYLDGLPRVSQANTTLGWTTGVSYVGAYDSPPTNYAFKGRVDEIAVYSNMPNIDSSTAGIFIPTTGAAVWNHFANATLPGVSVAQVVMQAGRSVSVSRQGKWAVEFSLSKLLGTA